MSTFPDGRVFRLEELVSVENKKKRLRNLLTYMLYRQVGEDLHTDGILSRRTQPFGTVPLLQIQYLRQCRLTSHGAACVLDGYAAPGLNEGCFSSSGAQGHKSPSSDGKLAVARDRSEANTANHSPAIPGSLPG